MDAEQPTETTVDAPPPTVDNQPSLMDNIDTDDEDSMDKESTKPSALLEEEDARRRFGRKGCSIALSPGLGSSKCELRSVACHPESTGH